MKLTVMAWQTIATGALVLIVASVNSWGLEIFSSPFKRNAEISGKESVSGKESAVLPANRPRVSDEWPELVESLFSNQPGNRAFGYPGESRSGNTRQIWDGQGRNPLKAGISDIRGFLQDNCLEDCEEADRLAEWNLEYEWLEISGLKTQIRP